MPKQPSIDDLTVGEARKLIALLGPDKDALASLNAKPQANDGAWKVGANYLIRTVTMINTGRLVAVTEHELVIEDAAWIASTGRFADVLKSCDFDEVEPFPDGQVIVGRGAVIDAVEIDTLPRTQK